MKLLIIIALLTSCSIQTKSPPLPEVYASILSEPYVLHENDCSNKCAKYLRALHAAGIESRIIIYYQGGKYFHAVVECNGVIIDPTQGWTSWKLYSKPFIILTIDDLYKYGDEFK